uniref:SAC domain-containing protein n=1 Tax=Gongylonema pulchrum TaxID=637853 RepID=A0A183DLG3_9BILA
LFLKYDGANVNESQRTQQLQLRMSLWHDVVSGFNSYFHGQVRIAVGDDTEKQETSGPHCSF